jgi:hypothetical protein
VKKRPKISCGSTFKEPRGWIHRHQKSRVKTLDFFLHLPCIRSRQEKISAFSFSAFPGHFLLALLAIGDNSRVRKSGKPHRPLLLPADASVWDSTVEEIQDLGFGPEKLIAGGKYTGKTWLWIALGKNHEIFCKLPIVKTISQASNLVDSCEAVFLLFTFL